MPFSLLWIFQKCSPELDSMLLHEVPLAPLHVGSHVLVHEHLLSLFVFYFARLPHGVPFQILLQVVILIDEAPEFVFLKAGRVLDCLLHTRVSAKLAFSSPLSDSCLCGIERVSSSRALLLDSLWNSLGIALSMPQHLTFELLVKCQPSFTCSKILGPPHREIDWLFVYSCRIHLQRAFEGESVFEVFNVLL